MKNSALRSFLIIASIVISAVLLVSIVSARVSIADKNNEIAAMEGSISEKENSNAALKDMLENEDIDQYAEDVARDQLGYGQEDEKVYVNITGK